MKAQAITVFLNTFSLLSLNFHQNYHQYKKSPDQNILQKYLLTSYHVAGTTWLQEIIYLLQNTDRLAEATCDSLEVVFPFLEFPYNGIDVIEERPSPRLIKTHLPYHLLPESFTAEKPKVFYKGYH